MKKRFLSLLFAVCMLFLGVIGLVACDKGKNPEDPQKLETPVVTLTDNVASWVANANADRFEISLDGNLSYVENTVTSKTLNDGQTFKVRAIGDGNTYSNSDWSNTVTYTASTPAPQPVQLDTTTVTVSETGFASWTAVVHASGYVYKIDNGAETPTTATGVQLVNGQSISVKAVGDGTNYTDSNYSEVKTYTASTPAPQPVQLDTPTVTVSETGFASWTAVVHASGYVYKIDNGVETPTTATGVQLVDGQSISVKAVGDGTNYTDSNYSEAKTYTVSTPAPQPVQLDTPTVTVSETGFASWTAVVHASGYVYKIDNGVETPTTATGVQLVDGQSISVKAVGDGTNYTDSNYSEVKTYTASGSTPPVVPPATTEAPTYLGIRASLQVPTENDVPTEFTALSYAGTYGARVSLEEALRAYLGNADNALGEDAPVASDYAVYSAIGNTVYIQIWLNNPDQNTILSLKLNGMKHQTGGALQSFFIAEGDSYLNCVYVAVTIPTGSYEEITYEVTEIEYVEGTNISQDGKAVLIDEENDTVTVGLPYAESLPAVTFSGETKTASDISFQASVTDEDNYVALVGGWLRVIIFDNNNVIVGQQKLVAGNNTVSFANLSADTYYNVIAFVLGDAHDGNGVYVHTVASAEYQTESVISCETQSAVLFNEQTGKYYPQITVNAMLNDTSFTFTKVEVCDWDGTVYYTGEFNGSANITDGILNGQGYVVKVYYENALGVEQSYQDYVSVDRLDYPWILEPCLQYGLIDDAVLGFDFGENKSNFENLTIKILDENSKQYLAEDAIYLIDNPNAVAELEAQWRNYGEGWDELYDRWYKLKQSQEKINEYYPDVEKAEWEAELAKGIYTYVYVYGQDDNFFKGANNKYYILLDGYQSKRVNDYSWKYILSADFDLNNGEDVEENRTIVDGWFNIDPALTEDDYLFVASDEDYNELFTLDENNVVYLEVMSRNNMGNESARNLGYVNQIVLAQGYDIYDVLWTQDEPNHDIDETAWFAEIRQVLIAGEDINSVFPLGLLQPITFDLDDVEIDTELVGNFDIRFTYKMYGKTYTTEKPYDWDGGTISYTLTGALPTVGISFKTNVEEFGRWEITSPDWVKDGVWNFQYTIEVRDENQQLVGTYNQDNYGEYTALPRNYSIRVRLDSHVGYDYYTQGAWSDWFTCLPIELSTPTNFTQSYTQEGVSVSWDYIAGAEKFVYVINGGAEQETSGYISGLTDGDTVKVKAVPAVDSNYVESDYSKVYTVVDARTQLATPTNIIGRDKMLFWQEVENATYYEVEFLQDGVPHITTASYPEYNATIGKSYRIRACNEDVENYKSSDWSESYLYTVTLENPTFNEIRNERVYWNRVEYAGGYNYKIGENGEVLSTNRYYVALSEIPVGEKLYVQAYADGCDSTAWVMIYHNVIVLATPSVSVSGGTASWDAVENATGYVYKINDGEEVSTTETSVSGLVSGDRIVVRATSTQNGYTDSDWSEERTQLPTMSAPVVDTTLLFATGQISWAKVEGASSYICEVDGVENTCYGSFSTISYNNIPMDAKVRVRAVSGGTEYEVYGEWSEYYTREDTREPMATPTIAYDSEVGLTVVANEYVAYYIYKFGQDGEENWFYPEYTGGAEVITQEFIFPEGENTVYVKAVPLDGVTYRESDWASLEIVF